MKKSLWNMQGLALAAGVALAAVAPAQAAPVFVPSMPKPDVIRVQDSAKIVRPDKHDGSAWKKRRHDREHRREYRKERRDHGSRANLYRPKSTPKYAYDAYGNFRVYDGKKRWKDYDRWDDGWDKKRKHRRLYKMNSFGYQEPSPELKDVLTAVPD